MNHTLDRNGDTHRPAGSETSGSENRTLSLEADQQEQMIAVGGCSGIYMVPRRHVDDYYQAHGYVAAGAAILLGLKSLALAF